MEGGREAWVEMEQHRGQMFPPAQPDYPSSPRICGEKLCHRGQHMVLEVKAGFDSGLEHGNPGHGVEPL